MNNDNIELKNKINSLIWQHSPATLPLHRAEDVACDVLAMIINGENIEQTQANRIFNSLNHKNNKYEHN